jgi:outer membrane protein assembly factor BamB
MKTQIIPRSVSPAGAAFYCNLLIAASFVSILLFCCSSANGFDDWPHWRGPNRNDVSLETGLLKEWPADGPKQLWINRRSGLGYAGFSVVDGKLYTMGLEDDIEFALCLNAEDGTEIWRERLGNRFKNGSGDGPRSTPSIDGDRAYFMGASGNLSCRNKEDGKQIWSVEMSDFGGSVPNWGYAESPLVDEDKVICTPGGSKGTILALDKKTGEKIWQSKPVTRVLDNGAVTSPAKAHYSSILPVNWNNRRQYVQLTVLAVVGVDAETGDVLWQTDWPGKTAVIPSPIFDGGNVYVTSGYGVGAKLIKIDGDNDATELWYTKAMQNHHGGVILIGDYLFGSSARSWVCQRKSDGEMVWSDRAIKKGALAYADGMFYQVQESDGKVLLIQADENSHDVKGSFTLSPQTKRRSPRGKIWVHPVIANGKLYLRDQEMIYCYDISAK